MALLSRSSRSEATVTASKVLLEGNLLSGMGEAQAGEVTQMRVRPIALAQITMPQAQEKGFKAQTRFALIGHRPVSGAHQVAHGFVLLVGHVDGGQLSGSK